MTYTKWLCTETCTDTNAKLYKKGKIYIQPTIPVSGFFVETDFDKREYAHSGAVSMDIEKTFRVEHPQWEDLRFPLIGNNIDITTGRIDYNFDECCVGYQDLARYPNEPTSMAAQMPHGKKQGSPLRPHLHWQQGHANIPNWLLEYRICPVGLPIPSTFTQTAANGHMLSYVSGEVHQITSFPEIEMPADEGVSAIVDIRLYRDTLNTSGLFAGLDTLVGDALAKEFDLHYQANSLGSGTEFEK